MTETRVSSSYSNIAPTLFHHKIWLSQNFQSNISFLFIMANPWKLKEQKAHERFNPHIDEEFEDSEGNVVNRKTYDDMRRQGIL